MAIQKALLLIADIGGYTRFMKVHRLNLAHAQLAVASLLEAVLDGSQPFKLAKLEGDAAFLWMPLEGDESLQDISQYISRMREGFLKQRAIQLRDRACDCDSCEQLEKLSLKFVAHAGEVAEQKVHRQRELAGLDVILVHRMPKNDVPVSEYVLMTEPVRARLPDSLAAQATALEHDFEGIGNTATHFVTLDALAQVVPPLPQKSWLSRKLTKLWFELRAVPFMLGLRTALKGFRNTGFRDGR